MVPATSAQARLSAPDAPTAVAAARASTAWAWATAAPDAGRSLAVALTEQLVRLGGEFLGAAEVLWSGHLASSDLVVRYRSNTARSPANFTCLPANDHEDAAQERANTGPLVRSVTSVRTQRAASTSNRDGEGQRGSADQPPRTSAVRHGWAECCQF